MIVTSETVIAAAPFWKSKQSLYLISPGLIDWGSPKKADRLVLMNREADHLGLQTILLHQGILVRYVP